MVSHSLPVVAHLREDVLLMRGGETVGCRGREALPRMGRLGSSRRPRVLSLNPSRGNWESRSQRRQSSSLCGPATTVGLIFRWGAIVNDASWIGAGMRGRL